MLRNFTKEIHLFCKENAHNDALTHFIPPLIALNQKWADLTLHIGTKALENADEAGAASVDYLMFSGYACLAYFWAKAALTAQQGLASGSEDSDFYEAKLHTASFYYDRILPRTLVCEAGILSGAANLMSVSAEQF